MPTNMISMQQPTDYTSGNMETQRRMAMAQALQQQALAPIEQQTAGGRVVPISPWQGIARLAQAFASRKIQDSAEESANKSAQTYQEKLAQTLQAFGQEQDPQKKLSILAQHPATQAMLPKYMEHLMPQKPVVVGRSLINPQTNQVVATDETWKGEQEAARTDKATQAEASRQQRAELAAQQEAMRRELAGQSSADRRLIAGMVHSGQNKAPAGYRYKENGDLEQIPGGPADQKTQQRLEGGGTVDSIVASLRDQYDQLDKANGITNPEKGVFSNLAAGASSSGIGQAVGKMVGSENQSKRNTVAQQRPLLLQAIMKATGMSAKQMDSNVELKLYLATATDPTLDVAANKRALDKIEELYGSRAGQQKGAQATPPAAPQPKEFNALPDPAQFNGKRMKAPDGSIIRSNGKQWVKE